MQKPMQPTLPLTSGRARRKSAAPSRSPSTVSSDIENSRFISRLQVVHRRRAAFARVQVDAERNVADVGQAVGDVADVLVEPVASWITIIAGGGRVGESARAR
jgi:hypothetical protein